MHSYWECKIRTSTTLSMLKPPLQRLCYVTCATRWTRKYVHIDQTMPPLDSKLGVTMHVICDLSTNALEEVFGHSW